MLRSKLRNNYKIKTDQLKTGIITKDKETM